MSAEFEIFSLEEHVANKSMWSGALTKVSIPNCYGAALNEDIVDPESSEIGDDKDIDLFQITDPQTPALFKIFDEVIVNCMDHTQENKSNKSNKVTLISVKFDRAGEFSIRNDGPGIPIMEHAKASAAKGRKIYNPEVAFGWLLTGSNLNRQKHSVKAGVNGIGAKLANIHSHKFCLDTVDSNSKQRYTQTFRDRLKVIEPPVVKFTKLKSFTEVSFNPAYSELDYTYPLSEIDYMNIKGWIVFRLCETAVYVGSNVNVLFNDRRISTHTIAKFARLLISDIDDGNSAIISSAVKPPTEPYSKFPWSVAVVVSKRLPKFAHRTIFSGVVIDKSPHLLMYKKQINENVNRKIRLITKDKDKEYKLTETSKYIYLITVGVIFDCEWNSQSKTEVQIAESKLKQYELSASALNKISESIAEFLLVDLNRKNKMARKGKIEVDKYIMALKLNSREKNYLMVAEGDSAISFLRSGLAGDGKRTPSFNNYGVLSLGGVVMNARKNITKIELTSGAIMITRSEKLQTNKVLNAIVEVIGLDYDLTYDNPDDMSKLKYTGIIGCTDQDLDGTGKILPLVMVFIFTFWPNLIRCGFFKKFMTPVIRAYPKRGKSRAIVFYYEKEFNDWCTRNDSTMYNIRYYKGLASHEPKEVSEVFGDFRNLVYTFTADDVTSELFEIYYGPDANLRKEVLKTPVDYALICDAENQTISCNTQLNVDSKAYKLEAIRRQIPHAIDGLKPAMRKIVCGSMRLAAQNNKERKVFQLGGSIAENEFYHHGDVSLSGTIIHMANCYPGAKRYPLLIGIGQFGTRQNGASDAGSPRYISVKLASQFVDSVFPSNDKYLYSIVKEDGEEAEPVFYVPIIPMAIFEDGHCPSEGWAHTSYGRLFSDVCIILERMLTTRANDLIELSEQIYRDECVSAPVMELINNLRFKYPLSVDVSAFTGEVRPYNGTLYHYGVYEYDPEKNTIIVMDLPITVCTETFIKMLNNKPENEVNPFHQYIVTPVSDYSPTNGVKIIIKLQPNAWEQINENFGTHLIDPVEDFLKLRKSLRPTLNYIGAKGNVIEFKDSYLAVMLYWFGHRRNMYKLRIDREVILLRMKILLEENIIRYINESPDLKLSQIKDEGIAIEMLRDKNYSSIDTNLLSHPRYVATDQLEFLITQSHANKYDYVLNIRERDLIENVRIKREVRVEIMKKELKELLEALAVKPFAGANLWMRELGKVKSAITKGRSTQWKFM
jgi:DNA topoisomerase II